MFSFFYVFRKVLFEFLEEKWNGYQTLDYTESKIYVSFVCYGFSYFHQFCLKGDQIIVWRYVVSKSFKYTLALA